MPTVLIITVNYKGADATERFLKSASNLDSIASAHIIVVDNASGDGSVDKLGPLVRELSNVGLMESTTNRGYFAAASWARQEYMARNPKPDWVIVSNNDIIFDDPQFLKSLLARDPANYHVIAPAIIAEPVGADCNPFLDRRPSRWKLLRCQFWNLHFYLMWLKQFLSPYVRIVRHHRLFRRKSSAATGSRFVYAPHGAFVIFSRNYFEAGGYIDDGFFLYAEELSIGEICWQRNLRVLHDPSLRVQHDAHRVTGRMCNRDTFQYGRDGLEYALRKYFQTAADSPWRQLSSWVRRSNRPTSV